MTLLPSSFAKGASSLFILSEDGFAMMPVSEHSRAHSLGVSGGWEAAPSRCSPSAATTHAPRVRHTRSTGLSPQSWAAGIHIHAPPYLPGPPSRGVTPLQPLLCIANGTYLTGVVRMKWVPPCQALRVVPAHTWINGGCDYGYYLGLK